MNEFWQDNIMSIEKIEERWRANPLDTTFPEIPWWHAHPWCDCPVEAVHGRYCPMTATFAVTSYEMGFNPLELWPPDLRWFQMWAYCSACTRRFGEVNGSLTAHWCEAAREVVVTGDL